MLKLFIDLDLETQHELLFCWLLHATKGPGVRPKHEILSEQQNHRCCYCGVRFLEPPPELYKRRQINRWFTDQMTRNHPHLLTVEHVIRKVDGGLPEWENEVAACYRCNSNRGPIDAFLFFKYRETFMALKRRVKRVKTTEGRRKKKELVRLSGIEPLASCMSRRRSPAELKTH